MAEPEPPRSLLGEVLELEVGSPGHGGFCVARHEGRIVFVRHALPGELVRARVTEDSGGSYCRADAVEIVRPVQGRVDPPCRWAGPGRCGGCDWQHASGPLQRDLKRQVVLEQFRRFAGLDVSGLLAEVSQLPGDLLGWRTRIAYAVDRDGRIGLHRHRSHEIEPVDACLLGVRGVGDGEELLQRWPGLTALEIVAGSAEDGATTVIGHRPARQRPGARQAGRAVRPGRGRRAPDQVQVLAGPARVGHRVGERELSTEAGGFWQVHPAAVAAFTEAVLGFAAPQPGERVLELYAGAGALSVGLADAVGPTGTVLGYEGSRQAVQDAAANLADLTHAVIAEAKVDAALVRRSVETDGRPDIVVLDPPRTGAGTAVMGEVCAASPRCVVYVACDPVALARDVAAATAQGWNLAALRAFDAFPMTHHVECVALLRPFISP